MRQAFAGMLWSKQFYRYDVARWLDGDPGQPPPPAERPARPQRRLAAPRRRRHPLDARHVGVPVVRRLGPRLPLRGARPHRPDVRQVPARSCCAASGSCTPTAQLPAYEWSFDDVNPPVHAWAALRGVPDRRRPRPRLPGADLPQAADQLHLVGEPQGRARATTCSRAASSAWTTSARSTGRTCPAAGARAVRRDGWMAFYCLTMLRDRAACWPSTTRPTRTWRRSSSSTSSCIARGDERARGCGTRRTASSTTCSAADGSTRAAPGPLDGRADPAPAPASRSAHERLTRPRDSPARAAPRSLEPRAATDGLAGERTSTRPATPATLLLSVVDARPAARGCWRDCSTRTSSCRRTGCARCRAATASSRSRSSSTGDGAPVDYEPGESTQRPVRRQLELARPGLVPGQLPAHRGARSATHELLRRRLHRRVPDRLGRAAHAWPRSPTTCAARLSRSSCPTTDGRRPVLRRRRALPDRPATGATCCSFHEYFHGDTGAGLGASHQTGWTGLVADLISSRRQRVGSVAGDGE